MREPVDPVPVAATDPLYVLYTSGTTGKPKGIVRDNGGHAVALLWSMRNIYDTEPGDVYWAASDVGWVVGHSYIVYGPLLLGATTVLYEGKPVGTPDAGAFWRVASEHGVKAMFTAPTAIRAIKKEDPEGMHLGKYDLSALKYLFQAGERLDPGTYHWASEQTRHPGRRPLVADRDGLGDRRQPDGRRGAADQARLRDDVPMPGYDVRILRPDGSECDAGEEGAICVRLPLPPGTLPTLWGDDDRYVASYLSAFPGYYLTGDGGYVDEDGYLFVMGRTDDVINVAGHRLSTGSIEAVLATHPAVAECAVIGVADEIKGQVPRGLRRAQGRRIGRAAGRGTRRCGAGKHRRRGVFQDRRRRPRAAEDPLRQDPAQDHARHRRRPRRTGAVDHRGSGGARRAETDSAR